MRWLKQLIPTLLLVAAGGVVLFTLFSNHDDDYGRVTLPAGGTVELPEGTVKVFFEEPGQTASPQLAAPLSFEVVSAAGGSPVPLEPTASRGTSETQVQRSEDITSLGSVAKLDVPTDGSYVISASSAGAAGSALTFGTDRLTAVARQWKLLAVLLGAAMLIVLIPMPRRHAKTEDPAGWSSDPRAPYAG